MGTTTEKLTYLQGTKDAIKDAIVAKGVEVPEGTTFRGYAEKVGEIKSDGINLQNVSITVTKPEYIDISQAGLIYSYFDNELGGICVYGERRTGDYIKEILLNSYMVINNTSALSLKEKNGVISIGSNLYLVKGNVSIVFEKGGPL